MIQYDTVQYIYSNYYCTRYCTVLYRVQDQYPGPGPVPVLVQYQ